MSAKAPGTVGLRPEPDKGAAGPPMDDRELSWLDYVDRLVGQAEEQSWPPQERVRLLAASCRQLDRFFQLRYAGALAAKTQAGRLTTIRERATGLRDRQAGLFAELRPAMAAAGVAVVDWASVDKADRLAVRRSFHFHFAALLEARTIRRGHQLRAPPDLAVNLVIRSAARPANARRTTIVTIPSGVPRFLLLPDGRRLVPVEQVVAADAARLLGVPVVLTCHPFRVTSAIGRGPVDATADLAEAVAAALKGRNRSAGVTRLEVQCSMPASLRGQLTRWLGLDPADVDVQSGPLGLADLATLAGAMARPSRQPRPVRRRTASHDLFAALRARDRLVLHPYDTQGATVQALLDQAVDDPNVVAVKQTLYRAPRPDSPVVEALARFAEAGKETVVVVELRARFDEQANLDCARLLEQAGAHVVYGVIGRKTHAKATLVLRREAGGVHPYSHIGTGNYDTAGAPPGEQAGLLSADEELGADLAQLFNLLTGGGHPKGYRKLLVAPGSLRERLLSLIAGQAKPGGRIVVKVNALADPGVIQAMYEAAAAGAEIDLIVRDICCLRPGVPGLSDTIRVRSIVGRYVEHTRFFRFGPAGGGAGTSYYLGSADLLPRNLDQRIEVLTPVTDADVQARLDEILAANLTDDVLAWSLGPAGWRKVGTRVGLDVQRHLTELAAQAGR